MRAVGEALGLGRTFPEALLKALEGVEAGDALPGDPGPAPVLRRRARVDPRRRATSSRATGDVAAAKRFGLPGRAHRPLLGVSEADVRGRRRPAPAGWRSTPAPASSRRGRRTTTSRTSRTTATRPRPEPIVVLGSGPNRIGQGIEFDYCCVRAAQAFRRLGYEAVLVNSNPETVSTDYDTCDRLYLEPVTLERVLDVVALEQPLGVVVSLGGQTPLGLAAALAEARRAAARRPARRDRRWRRTAAASRALLDELGLRAPRVGHRGDDRRRPARSRRRSATPCSSGRHYVLGGRGMRVARGAGGARARRARARRPVPRGRARARRRRALRRRGRLGGRRSSSTSSRPASIRATRPACCPAPSVTRAARGARSASSRRRSPAGSAPAACSTSSSRSTSGELYVLEANPRASRTIPFVAKATGIPLVDHACRLLLGASLAELDLPRARRPDARLGEGGDLPLRALRRRRPTAASRCARPAR